MINKTIFIKDPVTQFFHGFVSNIMLKLRFVNIVSSNKHY
jgi:hypothetical protein